MTFLKLQVFMLTFGLLCSACQTESETEAETNQPKEIKEEMDNTPKVTGIGGIFFHAEKPKEIKDWYAKNLGMEINEWGGVSFETRDVNHPETIQSTQWTPFKKESNYFSPSQKEFMINYTVQNIEGLVEQLKANGVTVLDSIESYDYGKFVHIMDEEGHKIELWEPAKE